MTPLLFDIIIIALVILSAGLGFMRGFCSEVFTIFGWIGAVVATIYFFPVTRDIGRDLIEKTWLADIATASAIFVITLGIFSLISHFLTNTLHTSKLGFVDRGLGFAFGLLRAVVILGLAFMLFSFVFSDPDNRPDFIKNAKTTPALEIAAEWVETVTPGDSLTGAEEDEDDVSTPTSKNENLPYNGRSPLSQDTKND